MNKPAREDLQMVNGYWWPGGIKPTSIPHALKHVRGADLAISLAKKSLGSIAIQAGGNIGLWPLRMAPHFASVHTFEPEPVSHRCLVRNLVEARRMGARNVHSYNVALGASNGRCAIDHKSLGSHNVAKGDDVDVGAIDEFFGADCDVRLIQLDIEGYELEALKGAEKTIRRCQPVIQLELRGFAEKYGASDNEIIDWLDQRGFIVTHQVGGNDVIFQHYKEIY